MKWNLYSVFDPATESFDSRINPSPLGPEDMGEQFRRAHLTMKTENRAFMAGKIAMFLGVFDDETGLIDQKGRGTAVYEFTILNSDSDKSSQSEVKENVARDA